MDLRCVRRRVQPGRRCRVEHHTDSPASAPLNSPASTVAALSARQSKTLKEKTMGKYFLAWILGVPAAVLVLIYVLMH
jgi:hypothetical protein